MFVNLEVAPSRGETASRGLAHTFPFLTDNGKVACTSGLPTLLAASYPAALFLGAARRYGWWRELSCPAWAGATSFEQPRYGTGKGAPY
jgi:hypothetical protein